MMNDKEISLPNLFNFVWQKKSFVLSFTLCFVLVGLIIAFTSPKEWKSSTVLLSEETGTSVSTNLGALGSLAGIDLPSGGGAINPDVYEDLTQSTNFLMDVLNQEFYFPSIGDTLEIRTYLKEHSKGSLLGFVTGIPNKLTRLFKGQEKTGDDNQTYKDIVVLDKETDRLLKALRRRISLKQGKIGDISISVELQDKMVSALLTAFVREYVQDYVVNYYQGKELRNLRFIQAQLDTARNVFNKKSIEYARFRDSNIGLSSNAARIEEQRLQSEFNLTSGVYSTLAQRYEEAKIKVQEVTPVFSELEPVTIPPNVDSPKKKIIVLIGLFIGGVLSITFLIVKGIWLQLNETE